MFFPRRFELAALPSPCSLRVGQDMGSIGGRCRPVRQSLEAPKPRSPESAARRTRVELFRSHEPIVLGAALIGGAPRRARPGHGQGSARARQRASRVRVRVWPRAARRAAPIERRAIMSTFCPIVLRYYGRRVHRARLTLRRRVGRKHQASGGCDWQGRPARNDTAAGSMAFKATPRPVQGRLRPLKAAGRPPRPRHARLGHAAPCGQGIDHSLICTLMRAPPRPARGAFTQQSRGINKR